MKFCYLDESGAGDKPYLIMAGFIADAHRMHITKDTWNNLLWFLSDETGQKISEFKSRKFYGGDGVFKKLDGETRARIITAILDWIHERKHSLTFSAIENESFQNHPDCGKASGKLRSAWMAAAVHTVLGVQKTHQGGKDNKGHTILVFDHRHQESKALSSLIFSPPSWTDSYYSKGKKQPQLCQIVDVPYFVDSEHALLIQVADLISYLLRNFAELETGYREQEYKGESARMSEWKDMILARSIPSSARYPKRNRCEVAQLFWDLAPECLRI